MIIKTISLLDNEISEIQLINAKIISLKSLIKEFAAEDNDFVLSKLINELGKTQILYDTWFTEIQAKNQIKTKPSNRWNVDFATKQLQLLEN